MNQYTGITDCYDLLMRGGYYDHDTMAGAADAVMGDRKRVLELGVGTGLFAQSLAGRKPDCDITGVDFTPSMLEIARDRVGADTRLIEADVTTMDLEDTFGAAISSGGVWVIIDAEDEHLLGTHLSHRDQEVEGLKNVDAHLEVVTSSGAVVPRATIVKPMIGSLTPSERALDTAPSTSSSAPMTTTAM